MRNLAFSMESKKVPLRLMYYPPDTAKRIADYQVHDNGIMDSQSFPGHGIALTDYTDCATGVGMTFNEALDDALEQLAQSENDWCLGDIDRILETEKVSDEENSNHTVEDVLRETDQVEETRKFTITIEGTGRGEEDAYNNAIDELRYTRWVDLAYNDSEPNYKSELVNEEFPEDCDTYYYVSVDVR